MVTRRRQYLVVVTAVSNLAMCVFAGTNPGPIVINEIWNGSTATDEYVEFYNTTDSPVDVSAWTFVRRSNTTGSDALLYTFPGKGKSNTTVIPPHGYYIIGDAPVGVTTSGSYPNAVSSTTNQSLALKDWADSPVDGFGNASGIPGPGAAYYAEGEVFHFLIGGNAGVARIPNGADTGNNSADFMPITAANKTPGVTNGTQRPAPRVPNPVAMPQAAVPPGVTAPTPDASKPAANAPTVDWLSALPDGQRKAASVNKKILIYFTSPESDSSTYFDNEVFATAAVKSALAEYVCVKLDFSQNSELAYKLQVFKAGTFMVYDAKGQYVGRIDGRPKADEFAAKLKAF